jgi:hypothetical protein
MSWVITGSEKTPVDLYRSQVSLLLHGEGTTIVDNSPSPKTLTAVGGAAPSSTQKKFGDKSIELDGDALVRVASSSELQLGTGDFTLELWTYLTGRGNGFGSYLDFRTANASQVNVLIAFLSTIGGGTDATIKLFVNGSVRIIGGDIPLTTWTHIALCRASGTTKLFINGTQSGSAYVDSNNYVSDLVRVGSNITEDAFINGFLDEVRITKGVARYTADFTPPTAQFPDI